MTNANNQASASDTCYAVRKVGELEAALVAEFDKPETQETLRDARENYLAESIALNQAASERLAQHQQQSIKH
jgi:hypothetical protein